MRRNENQPRPTAGCLSVPLFNQKKRSRLPLTSNPSENEFCSGNEYSEMQSFAPSSFPSSNTGYSPAQTQRYPPAAHGNQWNRQANPQPPQATSRPAPSPASAGRGHAPIPQHPKATSRPAPSPPSAGRGYAPIPHPHKPANTWSQTEQQRTPGRQDSMATPGRQNSMATPGRQDSMATPGRQNSMATTGPRQSGYPCSSGNMQPKPFSGYQPTDQQSFHRQANAPAGGSSYTQRPTAAPPRAQPAPEAQKQNMQWKFKPMGHATGQPKEDSVETFHNQSTPQPQKAPVLQVKPVSQKSLRVLTAVIEGMRHWSQFKDKIPILFEIFATLDSAVTVGSHGAKNFLMRDGKGVVQCVFYENDQELPRLIRGQVHRCVGNYEQRRDLLTCVSVRAASPSEQRNAQQAVSASDAEMRRLVQSLSEL